MTEVCFVKTFHIKEMVKERKKYQELGNFDLKCRCSPYSHVL